MVDIKLEEITETQIPAFMSLAENILKSSSITAMKQNMIQELKEPFTIGGQLFKFCNNITTDDWLTIMNAYENLFVKTALLQQMSTTEIPHEYVNNNSVVVDLIQEMAFKYLMHIDSDSKAATKVVNEINRVDKYNMLNNLVNYSPEVMLIPRYFFQKMLFIISKSNLYTSNTINT